MSAISSQFWPDDIRPKIQTPLAILQARANELRDLTKGVLIGNISSTTDKSKKQTYHSLDVLVPVLNNFRQRLLTIRHDIRMVYPSYIDADLFDDSIEAMALRGIRKNMFIQGEFEYEASSDEKLLYLIRQALRSDQVKSKLFSLIAIANEAAEKGRDDFSGIATGEEESLELEPGEFLKE
jgi:hypothetical protein